MYPFLLHDYQRRQSSAQDLPSDQCPLLFALPYRLLHLEHHRFLHAHFRA